ncbi:MAG: hypothetical protein ACM35G_03310 [Planctomycetaceae bacterium]
MNGNSAIHWIKIGKYTINLATVRFVVEHHHDEITGEGSKVWLEVWCIGETKPVVQLHGDQAEALRDYLAYPKRVEDLTPQGDELADESDKATRSGG